MGFLDDIKVSNSSAMPVVPKIGSSIDEQNKRQKNRNIFENLLHQVPQDTFEKSPRRLNDFDSSILNESLVNFLPNDPLRLELQIGNAENKLADTKNEINAVKLLDLDKDGNKLAKLEEKKNQINLEIKGYKSEYRALGFLYKLTDTVSTGYNKVKDGINNAKVSFTSHPVVTRAKSLFTGFGSSGEAKDIIDKYNALQPNVEKITSTKVNPFGETEDYFKDFTEVMAKLNKLDFQANKVLNPEEPKRTGIVAFGQKLYTKFINYLMVQEENSNN